MRVSFGKKKVRCMVGKNKMHCAGNASLLQCYQPCHGLERFIKQQEPCPISYAARDRTSCSTGVMHASIEGRVGMAPEKVCMKFFWYFDD